MKTKHNLLKYAETLIFITIWLLIFAAPILVFQQDYNVVWDDVWMAWLGVLPFFLLFSVNHFVLVPFLLFKNKKSLFLMSAFTLLLVFSILTFMLEDKNSPQRGMFSPGNRPPPPNLNLRLPPGEFGNPLQNRNPINLPPFVNTIIISFLVVGFDTGLRLMTRWSKLERERDHLEKESIENQLAFLRNQISPHFFMNTLNNIHALIDIDTEEAKEAIIKLSKLMRHLLYDSQAATTSLQKEVDFIKSYCNLMKLRFSEKVDINLDFPVVIPDKSIPPLLFTSLIENAFKHGISYNQPSFIKIVMGLTNNYLTFEIQNSRYNRESVSEDSGIGIENTRRRLNLLYPEKYSLQFDETENSFKAKLNIPI